MSIQVGSLLLAVVSLIANLLALGYTVMVHRRAAYIRTELAELNSVGCDVWVAKHVARWERGELKMVSSRRDSGPTTHFIEPLPGWRISLDGELARRRGEQ
ncbi:hypothetical protein [Duganella vulcania]|uniref:Uncharacterized protein n=1 Tax=Duganella vulcania TaxID=2692166 RepID=A0A845GIJ2_9BURK|nr:hypothetical protein [Duganella vulcania]MYM92489.1 hypothetical protein [Duganella vulcania]